MNEVPEGMPANAHVDDIVIDGMRFSPAYNPHDFEVEGYRAPAIDVIGLGQTSFVIEYDPGPDGQRQIADAVASFRGTAEALLETARASAFAYYEDVRARTQPAPPSVPDTSAIWEHVNWWLDEVKVEVDFDHGTGAHIILQGSCDWEPEHGIELVFQAGRLLTRVGDRVGNPAPGGPL